MKKIKVLISEEKINNRLDELANQIMDEYKGKDIVFLCILKGSIFFTVELAKRIKNNIQFEFVEVSSYENNESTGKVKLNKDITQSIEGKEVIIIEDIVDTGRTLAFLKELLLEKKPASLKICSLLDKPSRRIANVKHTKMLKICIIYDMMLTNEIMQKKVVKHVFKKNGNARIQIICRQNSNRTKTRNNNSNRT